MTDDDGVDIARSLVTTVTIRIRTSNYVFDVQHGPDDLNIPDESFPKRVRGVDAPGEGWLPAGAFAGERSVFAYANAWVEKFSRRTVPSYAPYETAPSTENATGRSADVLVETADGDYRLTFDTTDVHVPFTSGVYTPSDGEGAELSGDAIPDAVLEAAREEVERTVDI